MTFEELKEHVESGARILGSNGPKLDPAGRYLIAAISRSQNEQEFYDFLRGSFDTFMNQLVTLSYLDALKEEPDELNRK